LAQKAGATAWEKAGEFPEKMRVEFKKRRKLMTEGLNKIKGIKAGWPDGAFYVWSDISQITEDDSKFCQQLLDKAGVAVIPGTPFGASGFIRLSFATSREQIMMGIKLIKKFVEERYG